MLWVKTYIWSPDTDLPQSHSIEMNSVDIHHLWIFDMAWLLPRHQGTLSGQCRPFKRKIPSSTSALLPDRRLSSALEALPRDLSGSRFTSPLETLISFFFFFSVSAVLSHSSDRWSNDASKHSMVHWSNGDTMRQGRRLMGCCVEFNYCNYNAWQLFVPQDDEMLSTIPVSCWNASVSTHSWGLRVNRHALG